MQAVSGGRRGSGVRRDAADAALAEVLGLFADPVRLPAAIAQTMIARQSGSAPMAGWSLPNQLLCILGGTVDARGIRQWNEAGRRVKRGSRCIRILAPRTRKVHETDAATGEESDRVLTVGFLGVPVFRVEDTEGEPLQVPDYTPPTFPPLYERAEALGVPVRYAPGRVRASNGSTLTMPFRGYYQPGSDEIVLLSHDERTFFHELAHAAHRRVLDARGETLRGGQVPRQEIVAEVTAAVLCVLYDRAGYLPHSREYVAEYAGKDAPARAAFKVLADVQAVLLLILQPPSGGGDDGS